jgi:hypothetical protein
VCLIYTALGLISSTTNKQKIRAGVVAHTCNSSYLRGRDQEYVGSRPDPISTNKTGHGGMYLSSSYEEIINRRFRLVQA